MTKKELYTKAFSWKEKLLKEKISEEVLRSHMGFPQTWTAVTAKYLTSLFGSLWFLNTTALVIFGWVIVNLGLVPGVPVFDPYPFGFLVLFVQFFTVFLSIIVLISQNRQGRNTEVRQRVDFEINVRAEKEITKILHMLDDIRTELGIEKADKELNQMKESIDITGIKDEVELGIEGEKNM